MAAAILWQVAVLNVTDWKNDDNIFWSNLKFANVSGFLHSIINVNIAPINISIKVTVKASLECTVITKNSTFSFLNFATLYLIYLLISIKTVNPNPPSIINNIIVILIT